MAAEDRTSRWPAPNSGIPSPPSTSSSRSWTAAGVRGVVLIERKNPPPGWALPGGFVDYGETLEAAAVREAREETSLDVELVGQLGAYSDPSRDPRFHTISTVFLARATGDPRGRRRRQVGHRLRSPRPEPPSRLRPPEDPRRLSRIQEREPCDTDVRKQRRPRRGHARLRPVRSGPDQELSRKPRHRLHRPGPDGPLHLPLHRRRHGRVQGPRSEKRTPKRPASSSPRCPLRTTTKDPEKPA